MQFMMTFRCGLIADHFKELILSLPHEERVIRSWSRVVWRDQEDIISKLEKNENNADDIIHAQRVLSVCAYDGTQIPAELLIMSLKNHDYFMTDTELVRSPLYTKPKNKVVFPSLSVQSKIESEIDFYQRKLDFVHVVSHEVRNPLTIVNAYANILRNTEPNLNPNSLKKLMAIEQYVKVIDQELTHIIETEQMLSNELYMKMEAIYPYTTLQEVTELMAVKSSVQNVAFICDTVLQEDTTMIGNQMGLRLILSNLISNAIKYTGEQGKVEFSARVHDDQIRFVISDNGVGMSSSQLNLLYEKYGKLNESKSGQYC